MKKTIIALSLLVGSVTSCTKPDSSTPNNNNTNQSTTKSVEYSVYGSADNDFTLTYVDANGVQQGIGSVKTGWKQTVDMKKGNTARLRASPLNLNSQNDYYVVSVIKVNGSVVTTDTSNVAGGAADVQYVVD